VESVVKEAVNASDAATGIVVYDEGHLADDTGGEVVDCECIGICAEFLYLSDAFEESMGDPSAFRVVLAAANLECLLFLF
jgi:hypothetical protein